MADDARPPLKIDGGVATALAHDSAHKHVSGEAVYVDDIPELPGTLMAHVLMSDRPHARIASIDVTRAEAEHFSQRQNVPMSYFEKCDRCKRADHADLFQRSPGLGQVELRLGDVTLGLRCRQRRLRRPHTGRHLHL